MDVWMHCVEWGDYAGLAGRRFRTVGSSCNITDELCVVSITLNLCRCLFLPTQVAQGALLGALLHPPQDNVLCSLKGAPREAQRMLRQNYEESRSQLICTLRPAHYPSAKTTRSVSFGGSTLAGKARSRRCTAKSGSSSHPTFLSRSQFNRLF